MNEIEEIRKFIGQDRHRLIVAIESVLVMHEPVEVEPSETICHGCSTKRGTGQNVRFFPYVEYPCSTIQAITAALGVKS